MTKLLVAGSYAHTQTDAPRPVPVRGCRRPDLAWGQEWLLGAPRPHRKQHREAGLRQPRVPNGGCGDLSEVRQHISISHRLFFLIKN